MFVSYFKNIFVFLHKKSMITTNFISCFVLEIRVLKMVYFVALFLERKKKCLVKAVGFRFVSRIWELQNNCIRLHIQEYMRAIIWFYNLLYNRLFVICRYNLLILAPGQIIVWWQWYLQFEFRQLHLQNNGFVGFSNDLTISFLTCSVY